MKYLKQFETHAEYEAAESSLIRPNVSICKDTPNEVHYNPWVAPETRVVAKFNVTNTSSPTQICYGSYTSGFSAIEIDGVEQPSVVSVYTFSTTGEHTVKYTLADPTSIGNFTFFQCYNLTSVTIPDSVTNIGNYAFSGCSAMTSCTIGCSVTSIGESAFNQCSSLTSITIPDSVTSIGSNAFRNCSGLTSATIGSSVTSIGNSAFSNCSGMTTCTIGSGVTSIGSYAFENCYSLSSITIPNSVTSIGGNAFLRCSSLPVVDNIRYADTYAVETIDKTLATYTLKDDIKWMDYDIFSGCTNLTSITIPSGITSIGNSTFKGCSSLSSITIPSGVTKIEYNAFRDCTSLTSITSNATTAPTIKNSTFQNVKTDGTLYVPIGSSGYDTWMQTSNYYLGLYNWTKVEQ